MGPLRDLGTAGATHRYQAALAPALVRGYLTTSLVQAGLAPARAAALDKASRITLSRVDLDVAAGQLERERVTVSATVPAGKGRTASTLSAKTDVRLSDYGAELSVLRPRASGTAATIGQLG